MTPRVSGTKSPGSGGPLPHRITYVALLLYPWVGCPSEIRQVVVGPVSDHRPGELPSDKIQVGVVECFHPVEHRSDSTHSLLRDRGGLV